MHSVATVCKVTRGRSMKQRADYFKTVNVEFASKISQNEAITRTAEIVTQKLKTKIYLMFVCL